MKSEWITYNKLVRDKVPNIIQETGKMFEYTVLPKDENYRMVLSLKMNEEIGEYIDAKKDTDRIEELADVLEVFDAILEYEDISILTIQEYRKVKNEAKGKFKERYYLNKVEK